MPTYIYNKKDFIDFVNEQVKDDEVIVFTNEMTGNATWSKKNGIKLTHQYGSSCLKDEGIGHIAFGDTTALGVMIVKKERLSEVGIKAFHNIQIS